MRVKSGECVGLSVKLRRVCNVHLQALAEYGHDGLRSGHNLRGGHVRRIAVLLSATIFVLVLPSIARAAHSLEVSTAPRASLLSPTKVHVIGTLTCVGAAASGSVSVVLIQPPSAISITGGGSTLFSCNAGERVSWAVIVNAGESSAFVSGLARFDTFAHVECSDAEVDCPSSGTDGTIRIEEVPTCFGQTATILGQPGDERIEGTPGPDVIVGRGGRDIIFGGRGDDLICGNGGSDVLDGRGGNDRLSGASGRDFITGVGGNDEIRGGVGNDVLNFGDEEDGADLVIGGGGDDDLHAGVGADRLFGNDGEDVLREGEVDTPIVDLFAGGAGIDTCWAGPEDRVRSCDVS